MDLQNIIESFSLLNLNENKIIKIQKCFRGYILRLNQLPIILYIIKKYLENQIIKLSNINEDGRLNSYINENQIIELLQTKFKKAKIRMWYDILIYDYIYKWIPLNIKITTTITNDNTSNLTLCVHSYTNEILDFTQSYNNGIMSIILFNKLKKKEYNRNYKKDYYFIVLNKKSNNVIINSIKGLSTLTSNINNLPFQICWNKNKNFNYDKIENKIKLFINCINKSKPSWRENFINNMQLLS